MNGVWVGHWLHCQPETEFQNGRRAIVKRLCFGPLESWAWGLLEGSGYFREVRVMEGMPETELRAISREELEAALSAEVRLCREHHGEELAALLQAELEALEKNETPLS